MKSPTGKWGPVLMIFALILLCSASAEEEDYDDSLDIVFGAKDSTPSTTPAPETTTTTTKQPVTQVKRCGMFKENICVKRTECAETASNVRKIIINLRESASTCHYLEACCRPEDRQKDIINREPTADNSQCGVSNVDGIYMTVRGGSLQTSFGEYPWVVALFNDKHNFVCTGTLIAYDVVLTTGTCVDGEGQLTVKAGDWDLMTEKEFVSHVSVRVKTPILHEKFNWDSAQNNIALLMLESSFPTLRHITPVCLHDEDTEIFFEKCFITGWKSRSIGQWRDIVVKVDMAIDSGSCSVNSISTEICAIENSTEPIYARGAPLVCPTDTSIHHLIGAWSTRTNGQTHFTDVRQYGRWIRNKVKPFGIFI
ncbi:phenoloxidase-activating factor 2-like [Drosophila guanche]|uniref:Blast:Serine proteinase stubble n=1 Tax=Drosophila guanche TaxID=7266 RepID=A0A3B0JPX7_DROGU|nr:phenoloxidase-activating factor 2-like [Drosophila guanche]SPP82442.1 blast:Serine proteinase stubble [Drosophila guanche]